MTRVALIADSHFDSTKRFEECIRVHDWIATDIAARDVDLVLHSGDVFERKSTPSERDAVAAWLQKLAAIAPVVIVRGNHDRVGDLKLFERLEATHPIRVAEVAEVHVVAGVAVGCLPWPTRSALAVDAKSSALIEEDAAEALRQVLRGLGQELAQHQGPRVLLAHAMIRGSLTSTGQPLVGCDFELALEDLALAGADFVALGHVHKAQDWAEGPVVYPGSPRRTAFGEVEPKGYVVLNVYREREGALVTWQRIETPCAPMLLITGRMADAEVPGCDFNVCEVCGARCDWDLRDGKCQKCDEGSPDPEVTRLASPPRRGLVIDGLDGLDVAAAEIRLRYSTAAEERDQARREAEAQRDRWLADGAARVVLEPQVIPSTRARAPEVASARTLDEKLEHLWRARQDVPSGHLRDRLLAGVHELERVA